MPMVSNIKRQGTQVSVQGLVFSSLEDNVAIKLYLAERCPRPEAAIVSVQCLMIQGPAQDISVFGYPRSRSLPLQPLQSHFVHLPGSGPRLVLTSSSSSPLRPLPTSLRPAHTRDSGRQGHREHNAQPLQRATAKTGTRDNKTSATLDLLCIGQQICMCGYE